MNRERMIKERERWDCVRICTVFAIRAAYRNPQRNVLPRTRRPALLRRRRARSGVAAATRDWEGVRERGDAEGWWQRGAPGIFSLLSGSPLSCLSLFPLLRSFFRALPLVLYIEFYIPRAWSYFTPRKIIYIIPRSRVDLVLPCSSLRIIHSRFCLFCAPAIVCILLSLTVLEELDSRI